jgi:mannose-6-phosphate isomerase-like protein (cupin superfamily)
MRLAASLMLFLLAPAAASAQQGPAPLAHYTAAALDSVTLPGPDAVRRPTTGRLLEDRGTYTLILLRRDAMSPVEQHDAWDDLMIIQEGAATVLIGGTLTGAQESAPGELRGGALENPERRVVRTGDVLLIPAGIPHAIEPLDGAHVTYLLVKLEAGRRQ